MFSKLSVAVASILITLAAAIPTGTPPSPVTSPTSPQCCVYVESPTSARASAVAGLLGVDLTGLDVPIGISTMQLVPYPQLAVVNSFLICAQAPHFDRPLFSSAISLICDAPEEEWGGLMAINCIPATA